MGYRDGKLRVLLYGTLACIPFTAVYPFLDNAWVASGHSMLGISMATGTGRLVSELINGSAPHVDPEPYRPDRF